ncbi:hypothetical protein MY5147_009361 [Beauveria neobassiana]
MDILDAADIIFEILPRGNIVQVALSRANSSNAAKLWYLRDQTSELTADVEDESPTDVEGPPNVDTSKTLDVDNDTKRKESDFRLYRFFFNSTSMFMLVLWFVGVAVASALERMPQIFMRVWLSIDANIGVISSGTKYAAPIIVFFIVTLYAVQYYCLKTSHVEEGWPTTGKIDFNCVTPSYRAPSGEVRRALNNATVSIQHGQEVSLIGRTGSGKSSMMLTLLHLVEFSGSISVDNREIKTVPRHILRSRITTLTQEGVELTGTVRFNMFPFDSLIMPADDHIIAAL